MSSFSLIFIFLCSTLPISVSSFANTSDSSVSMTLLSLSRSLSLYLSLALSDVVNPDRSMVLTSICLCSLLVLFDVMLGSSNIWSGGVTVAFLTEWDLHEFDCLTCNGITDLTCLITPTFVFICNTISCLDWFTTGAWK